MKVTVILIVIGDLVRVTEILVKGLEEMEIRRRVDAIQTTDQPEYWEKSFRLEETCFISNSSEKS